jgi:hypothetical protein
MKVCPRLCIGQLDALPTFMMYSFYAAQCCGAITVMIPAVAASPGR